MQIHASRLGASSPGRVVLGGSRLTFTPSHGWLERDLAGEDDCNSRTDEVYTNAEIVIITFLNARLNQYNVPKI